MFDVLYELIKINDVRSFEQSLPPSLDINQSFKADGLYTGTLLEFAFYHEAYAIAKLLVHRDAIIFFRRSPINPEWTYLLTLYQTLHAGNGAEFKRMADKLLQAFLLDALIQVSEDNGPYTFLEYALVHNIDVARFLIEKKVWVSLVHDFNDSNLRALYQIYEALRLQDLEKFRTSLQALSQVFLLNAYINLRNGQAFSLLEFALNAGLIPYAEALIERGAHLILTDTSRGGAHSLLELFYAIETADDTRFACAIQQLNFQEMINIYLKAPGYRYADTLVNTAIKKGRPRFLRALIAKKPNLELSDACKRRPFDLCAVHQAKRCEIDIHDLKYNENLRLLSHQALCREVLLQQPDLQARFKSAVISAWQQKFVANSQDDGQILSDLYQEFECLSTVVGAQWTVELTLNDLFNDLGLKTHAYVEQCNVNKSDFIKTYLGLGHYTHINHVNPLGVPPLLASRELSTMQQLLTEPGLDINQAITQGVFQGYTALHMAVFCQRADLVHCLLGHQAINLYQRNHKGQLPIHLLQTKTATQGLEIFKLLRPRMQDLAISSDAGENSYNVFEDFMRYEPYMEEQDFFTVDHSLDDELELSLILALEPCKAGILSMKERILQQALRACYPNLDKYEQTRQKFIDSHYIYKKKKHVIKAVLDETLKKKIFDSALGFFNREKPENLAQSHDKLLSHFEGYCAIASYSLGHAHNLRNKIIPPLIELAFASYLHQKNKTLVPPITGIRLHRTQGINSALSALKPGNLSAHTSQSERPPLHPKRY